MNQYILKYIKLNKFLFLLWYKLYRKNRGVKIPYFDNNTDLYIDGYPRSANTFFTHLVRNIFPQKKIVHHFHAIAPIKIAQNKKIPVIILLREPGGAISSNYLKHFALKKETQPIQLNTTLVNKMLMDYTDYYRFVKHQQNLTVFSFQGVTSNPTNAIKRIISILNSDYDGENLTQNIENIISNFKGATDKFGSSQPSKFKESRKKEIIDFLMNNDDFKEASRIYKQLLKKSDL